MERIDWIFTKIFSPNLSNFIVGLCRISMKWNTVNSAICKRVFSTTDIVMWYNHIVKHEVLIGHHEQHIQTSGHWLGFPLKISDARRGGGREGGREGRRDTESYKEKERERQRGRKKRNEGRAGLLAWDESAATRTRQNERPYVLRTRRNFLETGRE